MEAMFTNLANELGHHLAYLFIYIYIYIYHRTKSLKFQRSWGTTSRHQATVRRGQTTGNLEKRVLGALVDAASGGLGEDSQKSLGHLHGGASPIKNGYKPNYRN